MISADPTKYRTTTTTVLRTNSPESPPNSAEQWFGAHTLPCHPVAPCRLPPVRKAGQLGKKQRGTMRQCGKWVICEIDHPLRTDGSGVECASGIGLEHIDMDVGSDSIPALC